MTESNIIAIHNSGSRASVANRLKLIFFANALTPKLISRHTLVQILSHNRLIKIPGPFFRETENHGGAEHNRICSRYQSLFSKVFFMKRTLFVASNRLGDAVLTTGVLHYLLEQEPDIPITVVCGDIPKSIFDGIPEIARVIGVKKRRFSLHWPEVAIALGPVYWHRIVDFRGSLLGFLPARHRHIWKGGRDDLHKALANAKMIGLDFPLPPRIVPTNEQLEASTKWLGPWPDRGKVLALAPTANFYQKQWHYENYIKLAKQLTGAGGILEGARVAVFGAPGEEAQAMPVVNALPVQQVIDLVGKTTPMEAATILSQCDLFVGNDSGLMHTAVAVNIPTVGLFGIGKPDVYGPWGDRSLCLKSEPAGTPVTRPTTGLGETGEEPLPFDRVLHEIENFYGRISMAAGTDVMS
jgi:lipopolysaccharide export system permease protein